MMRVIYSAFGALAYIVFFLTFLYLVAFVGGLTWVGRTIDSGGPIGATGVSLVIDLALVALFGLQHSVMARPAFKRVWTRIVPPPVERSVYVLCASIMLMILFAFWRPIPWTVWTVTNAAAAAAIWVLFALGWVIVLLSTFLINHFELFGLTQVWNHARGSEQTPPVFRTPLFYRFVRHPLYSGFVIAFWAIPTMTAGHLLFASAMLVYIVIAIHHEERDLVGLFGERYVGYRSRVGMLSPRWPRRTG